MASSKPVRCGPCNQDKVSIKADIWCYNCDEGLCSTCSGHHKRFKSTVDHKTIDIQTYYRHKHPVCSIKTECDAHGEHLNLYCPSHLMPCCDECISSHHSKCTGIKSLAKVVDETKIDNSKGSVEKEITSILHFLNKMANEKSRNIKKGEHQYGSIKESISNIRREINQHLEQLEKKLCKEADTTWDREKSKLKGFISEIEEKKKKVKKIQDDLHAGTIRTSKLQSFLWIHIVEQKVHQYRQYVEDVESNKEANQVDIQIRQNGETEKILSELKSLKTFGDVKVVKSDRTKIRVTSLNRRAQVDSREQSNIHNMTMNILTKTKMNIGKYISDMICLTNERVIVVEEKGKVNLLTSDGRLQKQLPISDKPFSVTQINQDTIAITFPDRKDIKIFNLETETVTKLITLGKACMGLSFCNNYLAVGLNKDEIRIIDLDGNELKSIQVKSISYLEYLVYSHDRVIYTDYDDKAVYCFDESGTQVWKYTQSLLGPQGLCTDTFGNIIVADWRSQRIIVISKDGQDSKILLSEEDGLNNQKCIWYKYNEPYGFFCDSSGRYLAKFNFSNE
ncbi:uncharacterized protein LOC127726640 [Mytilus californianus]|uniref:uncharacterized protein LOC127726640 n=1 Tax=Mytilus californianus TaxID=6549 RepID=UPI002245D10E|nr:uncharacterized protein LOC127726640 [Mytilus californianus]XP_052090034.1 uncharacterized protein LOC127726640 [Mytilus californianus]